MAQELTMSDLLRRYPALPRSRVRTDMRRGRLPFTRTGRRFRFEEAELARWATEWLATVSFQENAREPLVIHNRDAVTLDFLIERGAQGHPRSGRPNERRRARIEYLRSLGLTIWSIGDGASETRFYLRTIA